MRHVLVFQLARFGDLVQTKRLLLSLAADAAASLHLCVDISLKELAKRLYPFAMVHALPAHRTDTASAKVLADAQKTFAELSSLDVAEVYFLNFSPLSFACASLFDPEQLRGYARIRGQNMRGRLPSLAFRLMHDRRFSPLNLVDLWASLHPCPIAPEKVNPIPRAAMQGRVGIIMAGREARRSLPPPVLAACIQAVFQARGGPNLVLIGSRSERALARRLRRELPSGITQKMEDLTGKTGLTDLIDLIAGLDALLTPDTGTMHLAAHLGIPVQAFFLSSAWCWETGPYGFGHKIWQVLEPCSPCRESAPCPRSQACLSPFTHKGFLAHLAGKFEASWPENLLGCISMLDNIGVTYKTVDGGDPYEIARAELRNGLAEYLKQADQEQAPPFMRQELSEFLYSEKDWMLPKNWRHG